MAPMNPSRIEVRQPRFRRPAILAPMEPVRAAISNIKTNENNPILTSPSRFFAGLEPAGWNPENSVSNNRERII